MNDKNKKPDSGLDGREIPLLVLLGAGAFWYRYGHLIQIWLHENLIEVALGAMLLLSLFGYFIIARIAKKNEAEIKRLKGLKAAQAPLRSPTSYYRRKPEKGVND